MTSPVIAKHAPKPRKTAALFTSPPIEQADSKEIIQGVNRLDLIDGRLHIVRDADELDGFLR